MTIRFDWDPDKDAENLRKHGVSFVEAQATGVEANGFMKRTRKYTNEPLGQVEVIDDFLPPPEKLVRKEDGVKVTIALSKRSVDFFKAHAKAANVPYQRMIRTLLDGYVEKYADRPVSRREPGSRRE